MRIQRERVAAVALVLAMSGAGSVAAQSLPERDLNEAKELYREARFGEAILKLQQLVERLRPLQDMPARRIQLADAYQYLGLSQLALNDHASAKQSLKGMIRLDRGRRLDPEVYAPKVIELFDAARTEVAAEPTSDLVPAPAPEASTKRRGRRPLVFLGVGAAAAAVGIQRVASNEPPSAGTIAVSPTSAGMAGATTYTLRATGAADQDGDRLRYNWEFGDGGSASGETATHVYASAGSYTVILKVSDGKSQTSTSASVIVNQSMAGVWTGRHSRLGNPLTLNLTQNGPVLGGTLTIEPVAGGGTSSPRLLTGTVSGVNNFVCPCAVSFSTSAPEPVFVMEGGQVEASVTVLTGPGTVFFTTIGTLSGAWTLMRR